MRSTIIEWLMKHATEYTSAVSLANGAIDKFSLDEVYGDDEWIWDEAQLAFDTCNEGKLTRKYK